MITILKKGVFSIKQFQLVRDFYILLLITLMVFIFAPKSFAIAFLFLTLFVYYISNLDYFWLAYAIIITTDIGGFFQNQTIALLSISQFDLSYLSLFSIVSFMKYIKFRSISLRFIKGYYIIYGILFFTLLIYGVFSFGLAGGGKSGFRYLVTFIQSLLYLPLLFSIPHCLNTYNKVVNFSILFFWAIPINILGQFYFLLTGGSFHEQFVLTKNSIHSVNVFESAGILRPEFGSTVRYFAFIMALFLYQVRGQLNQFNRKSIILLFVFLALFSNLITATRGWILALSVVFILSVFMEFRKSRVFFSTMLILITIAIALQFSQVFKIQIQKSIERLFTVEAIVEGEKSETESNARLSFRHDEVMSVFKEYPILGVGISSLGIEKFDQHTGNQSILATGGIFEFLIFLFLIINTVYTILKINGTLHKHNAFKNKITYFIIFLIGLLIIHSTSSFKFGIVGWFKYSGSIVFVILFYTIFNQVLIEAVNSNKDFRK